MWIRGGDIIKYTKIQRVKLWRYLSRMESIKLVKKTTNWKPVGIRTNGRPKISWGNEVINYLRKIKIEKMFASR